MSTSSPAKPRKPAPVQAALLRNAASSGNREVNVRYGLIVEDLPRRLLGFFGPREDREATRLTARERDVLGLIAKGYATAKVAEFLNITRNTASGYVKVIYRKLNISSRAEAALEASRRGIVSPDAS
ncbi:MAG: LuxR C-terminal-related transcriptional regulator [Pseudohongiellaceae bacterium]